MRSILPFLLATFVAGCDGDASKPLTKAVPIEEQKPLEPAVAVNGPKPAASDSAARQAIADLLAAHTKGQPSLVARFRNCVVKRTGQMNQGGVMVPAATGDRFSWPNRFRADWTFAGQQMSIFLNGDAVLFYNPAVGPAPQPVDAATAEGNREDIGATWMTLLVPLVESSDLIAVRDGNAIRVWVGNQKPHLLIVDPKSGRLEKVCFEKAGDGRRETWFFELTDFRAVERVLLPHRIVYSSGAKAGAVWDKVEYSAATSFPDGTFEKP